MLDPILAGDEVTEAFCCGRVRQEIRFYRDLRSLSGFVLERVYRGAAEGSGTLDLAQNHVKLFAERLPQLQAQVTRDRFELERGADQHRTRDDLDGRIFPPSTQHLSNELASSARATEDECDLAIHGRSLWALTLRGQLKRDDDVSPTE